MDPSVTPHESPVDPMQKASHNFDGAGAMVAPLRRSRRQSQNDVPVDEKPLPSHSHPSGALWKELGSGKPNLVLSNNF
jgi:hypothetical protein